MKPRTANEKRIAELVDQKVKAIKAGGKGGVIRIAVPFELSPSEADFFSRYCRWRGQPPRPAKTERKANPKT
jgi:4-aminobutyrate aminotransferase-like enzyme